MSEDEKIEALTDAEMEALEFLVHAEQIRREALLRKMHKEYMAIYMRGYHAAMRSRKNRQHGIGEGDA